MKEIVFGVLILSKQVYDVLMVFDFLSGSILIDLKFVEVTLNYVIVFFQDINFVLISG
jgi:hypothetical protein